MPVSQASKSGSRNDGTTQYLTLSVNQVHSIPIVVFAQVPPPEHGQSRMVKLALDTLRESPESFSVHHINARFSENLEDVGEGTLRKVIPLSIYLLEAVFLRFRLRSPILYYVPGPAKWSPVLRDWMILALLRCFYHKVVFHWHAIGHGEWAQGSNRIRLGGPRWMDLVARRVSAWVLDRPFASISVSPTSTKDSAAVGSRHEKVVCNGLEDPCPDFDQLLEPARKQAHHQLSHSPTPCFRILFLSHGTVEKGLTDALDALRIVIDSSDPTWKFQITFAGGVSDSIKEAFRHSIDQIQKTGGDRVAIAVKDYVSGSVKSRCYAEHDVFLAPSRWESFGLTVIEAMAHGMQIVAASSDGVSGVLPANHPYLVPTADPVAIADGIQRCCMDLRRGGQLSEVLALRQRFLDLFQIRYFSGNLKQALRELGLQHTGERSQQPSSESRAENSLETGSQQIAIQAYLADQNPGHDRSFGISRMSQVVLETLLARGDVAVETIVSKTSQQSPKGTSRERQLPWGTRRKSIRLLTDHFHPLFSNSGTPPDVNYFPKGYLPLLSAFCRPSVVTIHDTIIQYDEDHYPDWRKPWEYAYWALMLKHTLRKADRILTVSESSKSQIQSFMDRHRIPMKNITVTYEPCMYEGVPQPANPSKENYVIHLASCEPHKRTAHLIRWWHEAEQADHKLPTLHLIGAVPEEVAPLLASSRSIVKRPFLEDSALQAAYLEAKALILPSEIEGFGLPALEAYYLGTPVCFVKGTSVEEVLGVATNRGGFRLDSPDSLFSALSDVTTMSPEEVRHCGLKLRDTYAAAKVAERMMKVFLEVKAEMLKS